MRPDTTKEQHEEILKSFSDHADNWKDWCECAGLNFDEDNSLDQVEDVLKNGLNFQDINNIYKCLVENGII